MAACPACGAESPAGKRFCGDYGTALAVVCAACGAAGAPEKRFCADCGAPLAREAARVAPAAGATTERRLVSVLFADLVGFTSLSESRDAED